MDLLEKLKAILAEKGIDEEIQTEILAELEGEPEGQPEGEAVPNETEVQPTPEGEEGEPKEETEVAPPVEEPPAPVEEPAEELPPEEPLPEADPLADLKGQYDDLNGKYEESQKTIEALLARVDSLEEALRASGVIEGEKPVTYGVHKPTAPANDPIDDGLDDFFRKANRKF